MISAAIASLPTLESAWVDNLQCSSHTLAEDNLSYVTKGTRELQRQAHDVILQQRDSQQSTVNSLSPDHKKFVFWNKTILVVNQFT